MSAGAEPQQDRAPVTASERLIALDFIRGVAVLGILFANIVAFGHAHIAYSWPGALPERMDGADTAVWLAQFLFIDGKMRGLFTLLFGAGMALFMDRAWQRGETRWLQARRLLWLGAFGVAHFFLLFWGDILFLYAEAGLVALLFLRLPAGGLLGLGLAWYAAAALVFAQPYVAVVAAEQDPSLRFAATALPAVEAAYNASLKEAEIEREAFAQGSYAAELDFIAEHQAPDLVRFPWYAVFETIPLMLIGIALYRFGLFAGAVDLATLRRWGWAGVAVGAALTLPLALWAIDRGFPPLLSRFLAEQAGQLPHLPMILGYAALLTAWAPRAARGWLGTRLVAAGRMAFTNYILTSLVMMLVFREWAGGLFGDLGRAELLLPVVACWVLMLLWSTPWLERFRYGPLEWAWRSLTYWRVMPFRRGNPG